MHKDDERYVGTVVPLRFTKRSKRKVSDFFGSEWSVLPQPGFAELSQVREMTGETWRVFAAMLGMLEHGNEIKARPVEIAEHLNIRPSAVTKQTKLLESIGVIKKRKWYGWRLTPRYGFKGDPDKSLRRAANGELVLIE